MAHPIIRLIRADKLIGFWLLLWPSLQTAYYLTPNPPIKTIILLVVGTFVTRSTGCAINDLCDIKFDKQVSRTKSRPLVTQEISKKTAFLIAFIGVLISLYIALQLPFLCVLLAIPAMSLIIIYPLSKRWFFCPQLILGLAFAWPVLITTAAITNSLANTPWLLFAASVFWTLAYDTLYAMADKQDDLLLALNSSAKFLGKYDFLGVIVCYICCGICWLLIAWQQQSLAILLGLIIGSAFLATKLYKATKAADYFSSFLANQHIGGILLFGVLINQEILTKNIFLTLNIHGTMSGYL